MNIRTERRGLGRGLGELFQRTEPQPVPASANGQSEPARWHRFRSVPTSPSCPGSDLPQPSTAQNRFRRGGDE